MEYKQVIQKSRLYEYGRDKESKTEQEALLRAKKDEQKLKTQTSLKRIYDISKIEIIQTENRAYQIIWTVKIPILSEILEE